MTVEGLDPEQLGDSNALRIGGASGAEAGTLQAGLAVVVGELPPGVEDGIGALPCRGWRSRPVRPFLSRIAFGLAFKVSIP